MNLLAYGTYIPAARLNRAAIASTLGTPAGKGTRAVASYDEDTTSMGVEAARIALRSADGTPAVVLFSTAFPAYLDRTNATVIHAALGLPESAAAYDMLGSVRSGLGALRLAGQIHEPSVVVLSDIRTGLPGGAEESSGGDAAVAFVFGDGPGLVEDIGHASASAEFLDRWRTPGDIASRQWEERFGETAYVPLAEQVIAAALKDAGLAPGDVTRAIVSGLQERAVRIVAKSASANSDLGIGNAGVAQPGLLLADVLDKAAPGDVVLMVTLADGAEAVVLKVTDAITSYRRTVTVAEQIASGGPEIPYATFLTWRGLLEREPPRRPDPEPPAPPVAFRNEDWKYSFTASRCRRCGTRHLPPLRVCMSCHAVDEMDAESLADVPATVATYTVDRLAFSLSPPVIAAVVDFDGGGRYQCELTDADPSTVQIGNRVQMTFRRLYTAKGIHNYFWKARPVREGAS